MESYDRNRENFCVNSPPRAVISYQGQRANGQDCDSPPAAFPKDGRFSGYDYLRYDEGIFDSVWMEKRDRNYLTRILGEGELRKKEPDAWCLREMDNAQGVDIGDWWSKKLQLPNIAELLQRAQQDYPQWEVKSHEAAAREAQERAAREAQERAVQELAMFTKEIGRCALCGKIMLDPVLAADGETYEREEIEQWLQTHDTSPKAWAEVLAHKYLTPNKAIKRTVERLLKTYPELWQSDEVYFSETLKQRLLTSIREHDAETVARAVKHDPRLLTMGLDDNGTKLLFLALESNCAVLQTVVDALGAERLHVLPEIASDGGVACFREAATHLATAGARVIAKALAWSQETIQTRFTEALASVDLNLVGACLDLGANLEAADPKVEAANPKGMRPLHWAVDNGKYDLVRLLIARGADCSAPNNDGNTALHLAVIKADVEAVKVLSEPHKQAIAPIICAAAAAPETAEPKTAAAAEPEAKPEPAVLVVANSSAVLDVLNPQSQLSALHMALNNVQAHPEQKEYLAIVRLLINAGANLEIKDQDGNTALLIAVRVRRLDLLQEMLGCGEHSAEINAVNNAGENALHLAFNHAAENASDPCHNLSFEHLIPRLIKAGIDLEFKDPHGNTALLRAIMAKELSIVEQMLERDKNPAEINAVNEAGENALHIVARQGDTPHDHGIAIFLLKHGVDGFALNAQGKSLKEVAFNASNPTMAKLIEEKIVDLKIEAEIQRRLQEHLQRQTPPRPSFPFAGCWPKSTEDQRDGAPKAFLCPISHELMNDPVMDKLGHSFDKASIEKWLGGGNHTCPIGREPLTPSELIQNISLRDAIGEFFRANPAVQRGKAAAAPAEEPVTVLVSEAAALSEAPAAVAPAGPGGR